MKRDIPDLSLDEVVAGVDRGHKERAGSECAGERQHLNESMKRLWVQTETRRERREKMVRKRFEPG